eukprot:4568626-Karenia_brevis.AAC.1
MDDDTLVAIGWDAVDAVDLQDCATSPFGHYDDVPPSLSEAWACAMADVLCHFRDASTDAELRRASKWLLAIHDILLRLPSRGGRRGRG